MRTVAIIQARMGSSRLPGKVLKDIAGQPMLARVMVRVACAGSLDAVVVATTGRQQDDPLAHFCKETGWKCFRGHEADVLDRYYQAAVCERAEAVVRITGDCPLIDPGIIDEVVRRFHELQPEADYVSNTLPPRNFPRGLDTEVFRLDALERAWREAAEPACREHVTPYFYRNPHLFRLHGIVNETDESHRRWTVDTESDLRLMRRIYAYMGNKRFSWRDVLAACEDHPQWAAINAHVQQKAA